ncbi:tyrosine-protein phosphatase [Pseudomaricurvus sp. HS19]|uniref:tyrosine-protein phosphatase n=1 Tax=Pseudomaricurvus sp. HS19 TaxID=2692626 RepID=UPI0013716709|nr:CpsB/CapC family capsule biosynthesis tyrosine phosphatase [Pseudomaricurvus sp. HS19]MYM65122.1 capsular biosynthesis protein [Pseudomaricurvus sp. HS19]
MYDLHSHLLPTIDDGPKDLDAALALARQAVADGVTHSVVTPHIHHGRWENSLAGIKAHTQAFRKALANAEIPLQLGFAAEVRIGPEILSMLPAGQIPFLGSWQGKQVMLLEMPHSHILPGTDKIVAWLLKQNVLPMIAHPERNKDVMRSIDKLQPLIDLGCLFQVTAGSVAGQFGEGAQERAWQLLEKGVVTVLASDAHHVERRPVSMSAGVAAAAKVIGEAEAMRLVRDNPMQIVAAQFT